MMDDIMEEYEYDFVYGEYSYEEDIDEEDMLISEYNKASGGGKDGDVMDDNKAKDIKANDVPLNDNKAKDIKANDNNIPINDVPLNDNNKNKEMINGKPRLRETTSTVIMKQPSKTQEVALFKGREKNVITKSEEEKELKEENDKVMNNITNKFPQIFDVIDIGIFVDDNTPVQNDVYIHHDILGKMDVFYAEYIHDNAIKHDILYAKYGNRSNTIDENLLVHDAPIDDDKAKDIKANEGVKFDFHNLYKDIPINGGKGNDNNNNDDVPTNNIPYNDVPTNDNNNNVPNNDIPYNDDILSDDDDPNSLYNRNDNAQYKKVDKNKSEWYMETKWYWYMDIKFDEETEVKPYMLYNVIDDMIDKTSNCYEIKRFIGSIDENYTLLWPFLITGVFRNFAYFCFGQIDKYLYKGVYYYLDNNIINNYYMYHATIRMYTIDCLSTFYEAYMEYVINDIIDDRVTDDYNTFNEYMTSTINDILTTYTDLFDQGYNTKYFYIFNIHRYYNFMKLIMAVIYSYYPDELTNFVNNNEEFIKEQCYLFYNNIFTRIDKAFSCYIDYLMLTFIYEKSYPKGERKNDLVGTNGQSNYEGYIYGIDSRDIINDNPPIKDRFKVNFEIMLTLFMMFFETIIINDDIQTQSLTYREKLFDKYYKMFITTYLNNYYKVCIESSCLDNINKIINELDFIKTLNAKGYIHQKEVYNILMPINNYYKQKTNNEIPSILTIDVDETGIIKGFVIHNKFDYLSDNVLVNKYLYTSDLTVIIKNIIDNLSIGLPNDFTLSDINNNMLPYDEVKKQTMNSNISVIINKVDKELIGGISDKMSNYFDNYCEKLYYDYIHCSKFRTPPMVEHFKGLFDKYVDAWKELYIKTYESNKGFEYYSFIGDNYTLLISEVMNIIDKSKYFKLIIEYMSDEAVMFYNVYINPFVIIMTSLMDRINKELNTFVETYLEMLVKYIYSNENNMLLPIDKDEYGLDIVYSSYVVYSMLYIFPMCISEQDMNKHLLKISEKYNIAIDYYNIHHLYDDTEENKALYHSDYMNLIYRNLSMFCKYITNDTVYMKVQNNMYIFNRMYSINDNNIDIYHRIFKEAYIKYIIDAGINEERLTTEEMDNSIGYFYENYLLDDEDMVIISDAYNKHILENGN